jgi:hypothetical protein
MEGVKVFILQRRSHSGWLLRHRGADIEADVEEPLGTAVPLQYHPCSIATLTVSEELSLGQQS